MITNFNAGSTVSYPLCIWGAARVSIPPQVNVLAAMIFLFRGDDVAHGLAAATGRADG